MAQPNSVNKSRRLFVGALGAGGLGCLTLAEEIASAATVGPLDPVARRERAFQIRNARALADHDAAPGIEQQTNGDEETLTNQIGSYTKALPHNGEGEV